MDRRSVILGLLAAPLLPLPAHADQPPIEFRLGPQSYRDSKGNPYVTLVGGLGVKPEGSAIPHEYFCASVGEASASLNDTMRRYLRDERARVVEVRLAPMTRTNMPESREECARWGTEYNPDLWGKSYTVMRLSVVERYP